MLKISIKDLVWFCICIILILCFFIGLFVCNATNAFDILSGASTAVSIVLSLVAILYTMIDGANSSKIYQEAKNQLSNIDMQLQNVTDKLLKVQKLNKHILMTVPQLEMAVKEIEKSSNGDSKISDEVKHNLDKLKKYIDEDIDD